MADPISPFTPQMQQQLTQLLQQQTDRAASTTPIHQAAMAMAARMAPGYAQGAMTAPGTPSPMGSSTTGVPSVGSSGAPGIGLTASAALFAAIMKNPALMALFKGGSWAPDGTFTGPSTVNGSPLSAGGPGPGSGAPSGGGPSNIGGPGDLNNVDPNGQTATGSDAIANFLRMVGPGGGSGSDRNHDGQQGSSSDAGYL